MSYSLNKRHMKDEIVKVSGGCEREQILYLHQDTMHINISMLKFMYTFLFCICSFYVTSTYKIHHKALKHTLTQPQDINPNVTWGYSRSNGLE